MNLDDLLALLLSHKWLAAMALAVGAILRLLKSDTPLPTLKSQYRSWAALGLGALSGVLDRRMNGTPWKPAILAGLLAGLLAMAGHDTLIAGLRKGREIGVPKRKGGSNPPPSSGKRMLPGDAEDELKAKLDKERTSDKPAKLLRGMALSCIGFSLSSLVFCVGCSWLSPKSQDILISGLLDMEQTACALLQSELGQDEPKIVATLCKIDPSLLEQLVKLLKAEKKAKAMYAQHRASLSSSLDGGSSSDSGLDAGSDALAREGGK